MHLIRDCRDRLTAELPGILSWAVWGCIDWQREGLPKAAAVEEATARYRVEEDVLGPFLTDVCVLEPLAVASGGELYKAYRQHADDEGEKPIGNRAFAAQLRDRGFEQKRTMTARTWVGIGLKTALFDS